MKENIEHRISNAGHRIPCCHPKEKIWRSLLLFWCIVAGFFFANAHAQDATNAATENQNPTDEFSRKQREANWPAMFENVGNEFGVPSDILAGISLVQTRWFHFTTPTNQSAACTGMGRPLGIMGLFDDDFNGHNLIEAAKLIGKTPEELKNDPVQNCRGAAALLKKFYQETPLPEGTSAGEIESWRNAMAKYSGLPEAEAQSHAVAIFETIAQGDHELGIEWPAHPVNLEAMREAVKKFRASAKTNAVANASNDELNLPVPQPGGPLGPTRAQLKKFRQLHATTSARHERAPIEPINWTVPVVCATVAFAMLGLLFLRSRRRS